MHPRSISYDVGDGVVVAFCHQRVGGGVTSVIYSDHICKRQRNLGPQIQYDIDYSSDVSLHHYRARG